jgi:hypothetical protein
VTPAVKHGLLCGTLRQELLPAGLVEEADLTKDRLVTVPALPAIKKHEKANKERRPF